MATIYQYSLKSLGIIIKQLLLLLLAIYRYIISPLLGPRCRFYPCCSNYAVQALHSHHLLRACLLISRRITRCHPWHPGGYDPVPETLKQEIKHD